MKLVVVESPYAGDVEKNVTYARACLAHCLKKGEAPFASHTIYTQAGVLDDNKPEERALGITAGFAWGAKADLRVFYVDLGWSNGMRAALTKYQLEGLPYTFRVLGNPWSWLLAPLGPNGEEAPERRHRDHRGEASAIQLLANHPKPMTRYQLMDRGVSLPQLLSLETAGVVERDVWPGGTELWSLRTDTSRRGTILPPAPHK